MTKTYVALIAGAVVAACTDLSSPRSSNPAPLRAAADAVQPPPGYVPTPGGWLPVSGVHQIHPGDFVRIMAGHIQEVDSSRRVVADFGPVDSSSGPVPALGKGWIAFGRWIKTSGDSITVDSTTWVVPPFPTSQHGQTAFLWNGLESQLYLLQPVLQWGRSQTSDLVWHGGNYWSTACWFINDTLGFASSFVPLSSGDTLVGEIIMYPNSGSPVQYSCQIYRRGVLLTSMGVLGSNELYIALETLEAFNMQQCSDYPATVRTAFSAITIRSTRGTPALSWTPVDSVTDCGQHASVPRNVNPSGEVDVYYGLNLGIDGPTWVWIGGPCTWTGGVTTGTPPYTFEWDVYGQGDQNPVRVDSNNTTGSDVLSYQANSVANPFTISLTVTDAAGLHQSTSLGVNPAGYGCGVGP